MSVTSQSSPQVRQRRGAWIVPWKSQTLKILPQSLRVEAVTQPAAIASTGTWLLGHVEKSFPWESQRRRSLQGPTFLDEHKVLGWGRCGYQCHMTYELLRPRTLRHLPCHYRDITGQHPEPLKGLGGFLSPPSPARQRQGLRKAPRPSREAWGKGQSRRPRL